MSGANASPPGRSHLEMSGANASPPGRSRLEMSGANASPPGRSRLEMGTLFSESGFAARLDGLSDLLSPIVVKEVRQMVRGREFNYSFSLSLIAGLIVAFIAGTNATSGTGDSGIRIFSSLMACLALVGLIVAPLGAFNALRNERMERTLDLVTVTTLSPLRIVTGKLTAQGVKLLTLFAALAPFVAMSFLLGGIDFPTILYSLASLFLWSLWACAAALFLSCLSKSRALSGLIFGGMIIFLLILIGASGMGAMIVRSLVPGPRGGGPGFGLPFSPGGGSLLWSFAAMALACGVTMNNLILLTENRLLLPTENRSTALRIGFFIQFLLIVGAAVYPFWRNPSYPVYQFASSLGVLGGLHLAVVALFSVTEEMNLSRRIHQQNRDATGWRRLLVMFRPGGAWGAIYVLAQMALLLVVGAVFLKTSSAEFSWLLAICAYISFFSGLPTWVGRMMVNRQFKPFHLRAGILLMIPVAALLPDFLVYLLTGDFGGIYSSRHILDPFRTLNAWRQPFTAPWHFLSFGLGLIGIATYLMLIRMGQREWMPRKRTHETSH